MTPTRDGAGRPLRRTLVVLVLWLVVLVAVTAIMLPFRDRLDKAHIALLLLLVPLGASAAGGRGVGLGVVVASFLAFNWFFIPPYHTFVVADPRDWLILLAFVTTSAVAAQLLYAAQETARVAQQRAAEIDRFRVVGAEALHAGRAEDALHVVAGVIRDAARADTCELLAVHDDDLAYLAAAPASSGEPTPGQPTPAPPEGASDAAAENVAVFEHDGRTTRLAAPRPGADTLGMLAAGVVQGLMLPLSVHGRVVGVLRLRALRGLRLDAERWRFVDALGYYAALGIERVRLIADVERAEALRKADQLKDALLASVSHDLRTPLTTIKARAHQMRIHGDEHAEVIEQEADRLNRIVADLLDLSRLQAGAMPVHPDFNAVDELVELVVQRVEGALGARPLVVQLAPDGELLFGRFDLAHSVRIVVNLVENAHKYAPAGTPIELRARRAGDRIEVTVSDRGPGLAPADRDRVFEPFRRADGAAPDVGGAGLGLAIARQLAAAQAGELRYAPRDGGGSTFTFVFPAMTYTSDAEAAASA